LKLIRQIKLFINKWSYIGMKLLIENWRKMLLKEAAKSAKDLKNFHEDNWPDHVKMVRGLWEKYGMWKLGDMMNIGIPQRVKDNWNSYSGDRQRRYTKAYWEAMLKKDRWGRNGS
jgi:hypothetical protein